jgi:hypothetical protein
MTTTQTARIVEYVRRRIGELEGVADDGYERAVEELEALLEFIEWEVYEEEL